MVNLIAKRGSFSFLFCLKARDCEEVVDDEMYEFFLRLDYGETNIV